MSATRRRMTLPSEPKREDPIYKPAEKPCSQPDHGAAFILVHGLGDTAEGLENIADQFQQNHKLPYVHWIIPNAMENRDAMSTAWYAPNSFSVYPADRPDLAQTEDIDGLQSSLTYLESLIDACVRKGIPPQRIVLGGFSQGCALSLLLDLTSKTYAGKLGAIVGLMGYLPLAEGRQLEDMRAHAGLPIDHGDVPIFLARGAADKMIPGRVWKQTLEKLERLGVGKDHLNVKEYEGLGHGLSGRVLGDVCSFVERYVPALED
ncbi:hypothetical protein DOTSEDRAFT_74786 [Dothistroma septosporum NZE10]|uniref:Acyl-protein thioesterase 1 n=1 Tax=Dothistroma septosporum (strain NZE10 / CBS 128990) TaxID=675120 RepID=N1PFF4_DOTSN|nr:hypothetical protein DOTSEDRAFT_74786 [Dothistroma septosporum NZE10]